MGPRTRRSSLHSARWCGITHVTGAELTRAGVAQFHAISARPCSPDPRLGPALALSSASAPFRHITSKRLGSPGLDPRALRWGGLGTVAFEVSLAMFRRCSSRSGSSYHINAHQEIGRPDSVGARTASTRIDRLVVPPADSVRARRCVPRWYRCRTSAWLIGAPAARARKCSSSTWRRGGDRPQLGRWCCATCWPVQSEGRCAAV